jgi:hypothetical protein
MVSHVDVAPDRDSFPPMPPCLRSAADLMI